MNNNDLAKKMKKIRDRISKKETKDTRPTSLVAYQGVHTCPNGVKVEFTNTNQIW